MKIFSYLGSVKKSVEKTDIVDDLDRTKEELDDVVKPLYQHASDFFRSNRLQSKEGKDLQEAFYSKFDKGSIGKQSNFITEVQVRLEKITANLAFIQKSAEAEFERLILSEGLTARKALLLRAGEHLSFVSRMSLDVLNYVYIVEARASGEKEQSEDVNSMSPAEEKHVEQNIGIFAQLVSDYAIDPKKFEDLFASIPNIVLNLRSEAMITGTFKEKDLDPFKAAYVSGFIYNPIYHVRMIIAEWQTARYKANKDKKRMLELRLLHLEMVQTKKFDPKVEREIIYIRDERLAKLNRSIHEFEESVN